jgi:hypothetical protein
LRSTRMMMARPARNAGIAMSRIKPGLNGASVLQS